MSRKDHLLLLIFMGGAWPVSAQEVRPPSSTGTAEQAVDAAREAYGPPRPKPRCAEQSEEGEIVVCAEVQDQEQFRLRTPADRRDAYARETMYANDPQAPDVSGPGIFKGDPTIGGLCVPGLQKCPPPPAITVDFNALPEAPPGSDADRIGQGLPPTGQDGEKPPPR